jgi:hypothetical protein
MAINTGVNTSKLVAYAVLAPNPGVNATKLLAYAVLTSANVTPPNWGTLTLGDGVVGVAYYQAWDMPAAALVVSYTVVSGSLPPGLTITAISGNAAKLAGTPTAAGVYSFTIRATNSYGFQDLPQTVTITTSSSVAGNYGFVM